MLRARTRKVVLTRQEKERLRTSGDIRGHFAFSQRGRPVKPKATTDANVAGAKRPNEAVAASQWKKMKRVLHN
jgi:hypothetical protein